MADVPQRERVLDDLKGLVKGEVLFDEPSRILFSTDASIFEVRPLGVVAPADEADLQAVVSYAAANQVPLVPRGAGSGHAGECLGSGLIVDFSRFFRSILEMTAEHVRVQPGVTWGNLNRELAKVGRRLAIDSSSGEQGTVGGMVARNACGARVLRHGYIRDHVLGLRVMLDSGDAVWVGRESRWPPAGSRPGRKEDIITSAATLLERRADLIRSHQPRTRFNRCGYKLDVLREDTLDLHRLLVGSEGTLALFTEITLRTIPVPASRSIVLLGFESLDSALRAVPRVLSSEPSACELLDQRLVTLGRGASPDMAAFIPTRIEALVLVEYESDDPKGAARAASELAALHRADRLAPFFQLAVEPGDVERFWQVRELALPSLMGLRGGRQPLPYIEDLAVPVGEVPGFIHDLQEVLRTHDTAASFLIHAGSGQVEMRPFLDLRSPTDVARLRPLAEDVYALTLSLGGTISTQYGTGLARTPWVEKQYADLFPVFRDLKAIFDPRRIFNPGKIVGPDVSVPAWPLRYQHWRQASAPAPGGGELASEPAAVTITVANGEAAQAASSTSAPALQLLWKEGSFRDECVECNGCGQCRTEAPTQRMCPIFRAKPQEAATPRAKANLLRNLIGEANGSLAVSSDEVREVANLCVNCKMCRQECPAHVNIPKLMLETKAINVAQHGMRFSDWVVARSEAFARIGSAFAPLINMVLDNGAVRWGIEKVLGISRHRPLPTFARRSFASQANRRGWTHPVRSERPRVAYFVDIFANYNDPTIAEAAVAVLHHQGIEVHVPPGQRGCGMAALANGDIETAREALEHNLHILAEPAREGYAIVCSEPTAAVMLAQDSLDLLNTPDAQLVANRVVELTTFLGDLHQQGRLRTDFGRFDITVGHHVPCHIKALGRAPAGPALLSLIPGLRVHTIDVNCSGMAGTFGLKAENFQLSVDAGRPMLERFARPGVLFGSTECSSCRMQMEGITRKRTLHPVQYLALAYGLMPDLVDRLRQPVGEKVLG